MAFDTLDYKDWLRTNTSLGENSISLYARTANAFFREYDELTLESINAYVSRSFREKNSNYVKYSFKPLLEYKGMDPELYKKIVKVKQRPRKKHGNYLGLDIINKIIDNIKREEYRDITRLQLAMGSRAFEVIELREEKIDWEHRPGVIRIFLSVKGGREGSSFLSAARYEDILRKYCNGKPGYLFLDDPNLQFDEELLKRAVNTKRSYVYDAINRSAAELGLDRKIGTHDLRRNFAEHLEQSGEGLRTIQKALNHSRINTTSKYFSDSREDVRDAVIKHQEGDDVRD